MKIYFNAELLSDGRRQHGYVGVKDGIIVAVGEGTPIPGECDEMVDLEGAYLMPGVIDSHVHFREPGLTQKADISSESKAAKAGGVMTVVDMPNVAPPTLHESEVLNKLRIADCTSAVDYFCWLGVGTSNQEDVSGYMHPRVPGLKLFMGASTGNMSIEDDSVLKNAFSAGKLLLVHCEDNGIILANKRRICAEQGTDDPAIECHASIRDEKACLESTCRAIELARQYATRLHVLHVSTCEELSLLQSGEMDRKQITAEACVGHLIWTSDDYKELGTKIKCNPSIKSKRHRDALRRELLPGGKIDVVSTDHAPHQWSDKVGGALKAASGFPSIQFSLPAMMDLSMEVDGLTPQRVAQLMTTNQAKLLGLTDRGSLKVGMKALLVAVTKEPFTVTKDMILSKCGWSPFEGHTFHHKVRVLE